MNLLKSISSALGAVLLIALILMLPADAQAAAAGWQEVLRGHPKIFYMAAAGVVFVIVWAWRRFARASWDFVTRENPRIQMLPALVLSGLISAAPAIGQDFWNALVEILEGVLFSGVAPIIAHHVMKAVPQIPYGNPPKQDAPPVEPR
jgi:hypothetical protein